MSQQAASNRGAAANQRPIFPCAQFKLDQFFLQWLSENQNLVGNIIEDVVAGRPLQLPSQGPQHVLSSASPPLSPSAGPHVSIFSNTPPLSPSVIRSPRSPISVHRRSLSSSITKLKPKEIFAEIPKFYFPPSSEEQEAEKQKFIESITTAFVAKEADNISQKEFVDMTQEVCQLPTMVGHTLYKRLSGPGLDPVTQEGFMKFWIEKKLVNAPTERRIFDCLRSEGQEFLTQEDLMPLMDSILDFHPGLEFLKETAEFQKKYAETVVYRIFYTINRSDTGHMTYREFKRGDLVEALQLLDQEDDINKVLMYFSYEHFYVIYCKFWELDQDHDYLIDKADLARYSQCSLSYLIIDRIFEQAPRRFVCKEQGKMGYEDFVWFILSEEDKSTDTAIDYWFKCVDLDCDGTIRPKEMKFFYEEQYQRMEGLTSEPVEFSDMLCQMHDMLAPAVEGEYTRRDLRRVREQCGLLFNALFNLHKFLNYENRDPFVARNEALEFGGLSDWEKFARIEYNRLACEDDQGSMEAEESGWL